MFFLKSQLRPPKGKYIFQAPKDEHYKGFHNLVAPLWEEFEKYVLTHNHRQGNDRIWADCLNKVRVADLPDEVVDKLIEQVTKEPLMEDDVIHAFYPCLLYTSPSPRDS